VPFVVVKEPLQILLRGKTKKLFLKTNHDGPAEMLEAVPSRSL
jgi:hypothetical protein